MADSPRSVRQALRYTAIAVAVLTAVGLALTLGPGAAWVLRYVDNVRGLKGKELEDALDAVRGRALTLGTGLAALVAVYYTARNADTARRTLQLNADTAQRTFQLSEQGQVTERYTKAIEQLGSDTLDVRLGGIYALERIAADSARDHPTVIEVLTAFIREHTTIPERPPKDPITPADKTTPPVLQESSRSAADIQAAATVIGRRITSQDTHTIDLSHTSLTRADLHGANLRNADLRGADLRDANLSDANLRSADLRGADLRGADLGDANLRDVNLSDANLHAANLGDANLRAANLSDANLRDANLGAANLRGANLGGANLGDANLSTAYLSSVDLRAANLRGADLTDVNFDEGTVWPLGFDLSQ